MMQLQTYSSSSVNGGWVQNHVELQRDSAPTIIQQYRPAMYFEVRNTEIRTSG